MKAAGAWTGVAFTQGETSVAAFVRRKLSPCPPGFSGLPTERRVSALWPRVRIP